MITNSNTSFFFQLKEFLNWKWGWVVICLLLAYFPILYYNYAFSDDWDKILSAMTGNHPWGAWEIQGGRPLYGFLLGWSNHFISKSADIALFRGISLVMTICFVFGFICFLRWKKIFSSHKILELLVPLGVGISAPIYLYNAWYTCFPFTVGLPLMLLSYIALFDNNGKTSGKRILLSILFLSATFGFYQPVALLFCLLIALDCVINENESQIAWQRLGISIVVLAIGMIVALLYVKILPPLLGLEKLPRAGLDFNFYGSIVWFLTQSLPFAVRELWFAGITGVPQVVMGVLVLAGWLKAGKNWKGCLVLLVLFIIGLAPLLLTAEKWVATRSSCVTISFCVVYLLFLFGSFSERRKVDTWLAVTVCLVLIVGNTVGFNKYFIQTSMRDYSELKTYMETVVGDKNEVCVNYDLTNRNYAASHRVYSDEIAIRSSAIEWAYPGMLKQISVELGKTINWKNCSINTLHVQQVDIAQHKP